MNGARILVVDDSPTILKVVSSMLSARGYVPQTARDGLMGIELIKRGHSFDLVLLDFVMPRMNGYQFCRELRSLGADHVPPVVLMSAKTERIRDQFREQTGAVGAIAKPFDIRTLVTTIEAAFSKATELADEKARKLTERADDADTRAGASTIDEKTDGDRDFARRAGALAAARIVEMSPRERLTISDVERVIVEALAASGALDTFDTRPPISRPTPIALGRSEEKEVLSGDLAVVPLAEVMQLLQMQRQTGIMRVKDGARLLTLCLRDGLVDLARLEGGPNELRLGRYFLEQGVASRADVEEAARRTESSKKRLGDELVDEGMVSAAAREEALRMQSCELVYDLMRWSRGRFWLAQEPFPDFAERAHLGLGVSGLMLEGFRRLDEWRALEGSIAWERVVYREPSENGDAEAKLTRAERLILAAVDGRRTVRDVVAESHLGSFDAVKAISQLTRSRVLRA